MTKGTVVNIERFAIHDGPGIRTVIFMKGCPLRCQWCSTPESQISFREMGYDINKCIRCGKCIEICRLKVVTLSDNGEIYTDRMLCNDCLQCVEVCPSGARLTVGKEMTVKQIIDEVEKDSMFYWNSGGGVTLSGGEPTLQPKFTMDILKACKQKGFHTAIETSGYVDWNVLKELLEYLDLVYVDIKHSLSLEHERLTGKRNELILENCNKMLEYFPDIQVIIRIPVIPGYNDFNQNIKSTAEFVYKMEKVARLELLPYHKFGIHMYRILLRDYPLSDVESPDEERMHELKELAESCGVKVQLGG